jgi:hypothetical protein
LGYLSDETVDIQLQASAQSIDVTTYVQHCGNPAFDHSIERSAIVEKWATIAQADTVQCIFKRYLELGSTGQLLEELRDKGIKTKRREWATGRPYAENSNRAPHKSRQFESYLRDRTQSPYAME